MIQYMHFDKDMQKMRIVLNYKHRRPLQEYHLYNSDFRLLHFHLQKDLKCDLCEAVLQLLDAAIEKNATKEKINSTVYQICDSLPGTLKDLVSVIRKHPDIFEMYLVGGLFNFHLYYLRLDHFVCPFY